MCSIGCRTSGLGIGTFLSPAGPSRGLNDNVAGSDPEVQDAFSIGEAASIIGVSTHVIRSWERRLSLDLSHRTRSNQRRYWMRDIRRFVAIRQLHESGGPPLVESAARVLASDGEVMSVQPQRSPAAGLDSFWAGLVETVPEMLLVLDDGGQIAAANASARIELNAQDGQRFSSLAPAGWSAEYRSLEREAGSSRRSKVLAVRSRGGVMFMDASLVPLGSAHRRSAVLIGRRSRVSPSSAPAAGQVLAEH